MITRTGFPGIVGPSYTTKSWGIDCQITSNWIPTPINSANAKTKYALYPRPGLKERTFLIGGVDYNYLPTQTGTGKIRGSHFTSKGFGTDALGVLIVVAGDSVYRVDPADENGKHVAEKLGTVSHLDGVADMTDDGYTVTISDGSTIYTIDLVTGAFSSLGTEAPLQANSLEYFGGYTLCAGQIEGQPSNAFFWSELEDSTVWPALNYAQCEGLADPILCLKRVGSDLFAFGPRSYECFQFIGDKDLPFIRQGGSMGNIGTTSAASVVAIGDNVFWMGSGVVGSRRAYTNNGYQAVAISTDALEEEWAGYSEFSEATSWTYSQAGYTYYVTSWATDNKTYVYCLESQQWFQASTRVASDDTYNQWMAQQCTYAYDQLFVGDSTTTKLYSISQDFHTDNGTQIVRRRRSPHMTKGMMTVRHQYATVDCEVGNGLSYGQGVNPQMMLKYSDDGGQTWSADLWLPTGAKGKYRTLVNWQRLGEAKDRVYEISCSDPVRWVIYGMELGLEDKAQRI